MDSRRNPRGTDPLIWFASHSQRAFTAALITGCALLASRPANAEFVDPTFPVTDYFVQCLSVNGSRLYAGGGIQNVFPNTGGFAAISASSGTLCGGWPRVDGAVLALEPDSAGGWFIGGSFSRVAGVPRNNLAHVRADGTLDAWNPGANALVRRLVLSGSTLFACGEFTSVGGQSRYHLAALDAASGLATAWNPAPNGSVYDIASSGSGVYVGGQFTNVGGQARTNLALVDAGTGIAASWNPAPNLEIERIVLNGGLIYLAGGFTQIGGQLRRGLAAFDAASGLATSWDPGIPGAYELAVSGPTVYVGGLFTHAGDAPHSNIAAIDASTGAVSAWQPDSLTYGGQLVNCIVVSGSIVYVGGEFFAIRDHQRANIAALDVATGHVTAWDPGTNATVTQIVVRGDTIFAAGYFSGAGGRHSGTATAVDLATNATTSWSPGIFASSIGSLASAGSTIYLGASGVAYDFLSGAGAADAASGLLTGWNPAADGSVRALATAGSQVFAGGSFANIGGQSHSDFAALDNSSALLTSSSLDANGEVRALAWAGSALIAGGAFSQFGGQPHTYLASLDPLTDTVMAWGPGANDDVDAIASSGSTVYVGGRFSAAGGQARVGVAALDASTGLATVWSTTIAGTHTGVQGLAVFGSKLYVAGDFTMLGGQPRAYLAALDTTLGQATSWNPAADAQVLALTTDGTAIYAGGSFRHLGGRSVSGLAKILPDPQAPPQVRVLSPNGGQSLLLGGTYTVNWDASAEAPGVESVDLFLSRSGPGGPWELIAAGAPNQGSYQWQASGSSESGNCFLRVDARDYAGNVTSDLSDAAFSLSSGALGVGSHSGVAQFSIGTVVPNPAKTSVRLEYSLPRPGDASLTLLDIQGRTMRVLANGTQAAGSHSVAFDSADLHAGLYFLQLRSGGRERSCRLAIVH